MKAWMQKACTGEGIGEEGNQHKVRVHDVWGSCHATVMLCLTCLGLVAAVDVTTPWPQAFNCLPSAFQNMATTTNKQYKHHKLHKRRKHHKHQHQHHSLLAHISYISYISSPVRTPSSALPPDCTFPWQIICLASN